MIWLVLASQMALGGPPSLEGTCDPKNPKECVQPLLEGEQAPFSGQLLSTRKAIKLFQLVESCKEQTAIEVERVSGLARVDLDLTKKLRDIDRDSYDAQMTLLQERLKEAKALQGAPWYESPLFVATVTVVVTSVVFFGAIQAVDAATK